MFNNVSVFAADNTLRGVDVVKKDNSYTIELTSRAPIQYTKTIVSANRVLINLKDVGISKNISTKFEGNPAVDSVMVEPCGENEANLLIQGDNIAYSDVSFKELNSIEQAQDTITNSFNSLFALFSSHSLKGKSVQFGVIGLLLMVLIGEARFIKSKYDELKEEKEEMYKNIEDTKEFKDYLPGYGSAGLNKPYTTPLYGTPSQIGNMRANYLKQLKTPETVTLNSLLHNNNSEVKIIEKIVHPKRPAFENLSNININELLSGKTQALNVTEYAEETVRTDLPKASTTPVSSPIQKSRLKANLKHLESLTAMYKYRAKEEKDKSIQESLNEIF